MGAVKMKIQRILTNNAIITLNEMVFNTNKVPSTMNNRIKKLNLSVVFKKQATLLLRGKKS